MKNIDLQMVSTVQVGNGINCYNYKREISVGAQGLYQRGLACLHDLPSNVIKGHEYWPRGSGQRHA